MHESVLINIRADAYRYTPVMYLNIHVHVHVQENNLITNETNQTYR